MTKTKKKWWQKLLLILCIVVLAFGLILLGARAYFRWSVADYYKASEQAFEIPGLGEGFIPQGLCYDQASDSFFITGYMNGKAASPIYIVNKTSGKLTGKVLLANADGSDYTGHCGGLSVHGNYVYVAGGKGLAVYSLADVTSAEMGAKVNSVGRFSTQAADDDYLGVAFTATYEDRIVLGEFYRDPNYPTLQSHKLTTKNGDYNQALALEFVFDDSAPYGIDPTPVKAYSLPDLAQGMCVDNGKVYISTSYGVAFSNIYVYDFANLTQQGNVTALGVDVPLYAMDSGCIITDDCMKIAPMSEEIVILDGKMYVMCESASNKYIFGKLASAQWCYATDLSK